MSLKQQKLQYRTATQQLKRKTFLPYEHYYLPRFIRGGFFYEEKTLDGQF